MIGRVALPLRVHDTWTSVVETLLLMGLAALLALGALPALRSYLGSAMVYVIECVINNDCRR